MKKLILLALLLVFSGCPQRDQTIMNPHRPHQTSRPQSVYLRLIREDGTGVEQSVIVPAGTYLFSQELLHKETP